jgi:hypothetical protein
MTTNMRYGNRWTINETLTLQREYELLEWSVQQIAEKHRRSVRAIMCKLEVEGFMTEETAQSDVLKLENSDSDINSDSDSENIVQQNVEFTITEDVNANE